MVESVEHVLCHELFASFQFLDRRPDSADLAVEPVLLLLQPVQVGEQGIRVAPLPLEHLGNRGQSETEFAQQQDAL